MFTSTNSALGCEIFALIATAVNSNAQGTAIRNYSGAIVVSVIPGTGFDFVVKYILYIFRMEAV